MFTCIVLISILSPVGITVNNMDYRDIQSIEQKCNQIQKISKYINLRAKFLIRLGKEVHLAKEATSSALDSGKQIAEIMKNVQVNYNKYLHGPPVRVQRGSTKGNRNNNAGNLVASDSGNLNTGMTRIKAKAGPIATRRPSMGISKRVNNMKSHQVSNSQNNSRPSINTLQSNNSERQDRKALSYSKHASRPPLRGMKRPRSSMKSTVSSEPPSVKEDIKPKRIKHNADYPKPWRVAPPLLTPRTARNDNNNSSVCPRTAISSFVNKASLENCGPKKGTRQPGRCEMTKIEPSNRLNEKSQTSSTSTSQQKIQPLATHVQLKRPQTSQGPRKSFVAPRPSITPGGPSIALKRTSLPPKRPSILPQRASAVPSRASLIPRRTSIIPSEPYKRINHDQDFSNAKNDHQQNQNLRKSLMKSHGDIASKISGSYPNEPFPFMGRPFGNDISRIQQNKTYGDRVLTGSSETSGRKRIEQCGEVQIETSRGSVPQYAAKNNIPAHISRRYSLGADPEILQKSRTLSHRERISRKDSYPHRLSLRPTSMRKPPNPPPSNRSILPRMNSLKTQQRLSLPNKPPDAGITRSQNGLVYTEASYGYGARLQPRPSLQFAALRTIRERGSVVRKHK